MTWQEIMHQGPKWKCYSAAKLGNSGAELLLLVFICCLQDRIPEEEILSSLQKLESRSTNFVFA